jgi:hypothetical protein
MVYLENVLFYVGFVTPVITPKLPSACIMFCAGKYILDTNPSRGIERSGKPPF